MCARKSCFDHEIFDLEKFALKIFIIYREKMDLLSFRKINSYNPTQGIPIYGSSIITISIIIDA